MAARAKRQEVLPPEFDDEPELSPATPPPGETGPDPMRSPPPKKPLTVKDVRKRTLMKNLEKARAQLQDRVKFRGVTDDEIYEDQLFRLKKMIARMNDTVRLVRHDAIQCSRMSRAVNEDNALTALEFRLERMTREMAIAHGMAVTCLELSKLIDWEGDGEEE